MEFRLALDVRIHVTFGQRRSTNRNPNEESRTIVQKQLSYWFGLVEGLSDPLDLLGIAVG